MNGIEARARRVAAARVDAALTGISGADLPPGLVAVREGDAVVIRGDGLLTALAHDARLRSLAEMTR